MSSMSDNILGEKRKGGISPCLFVEGMNPRPATDSRFRCRTLNCAKSYKTASSLFRHNKGCTDPQRGPSIFDCTIADSNDQIFNVDRLSGSVAAAGDMGYVKDSTYRIANTIEDNSIRDATCLCDPDDYDAHISEEMDPPASETYGGANMACMYGQDDLYDKNKKKQVILNPAGESNPAECFQLEDLAIDESKANILESYSWYGGVPQRDKAGRVKEDIIIALPLKTFSLSIRF